MCVQSGNTVVIKCLRRFDRLQSVYKSQGVEAEPFSYCFSIVVLSKGSCHGKYTSTLLLKYSLDQA